MKFSMAGTAMRVVIFSSPMSSHIFTGSKAFMTTLVIALLRCRFDGQDLI